jgi:hypothetical protein
MRPAPLCWRTVLATHPPGRPTVCSRHGTLAGTLAPGAARARRLPSSATAADATAAQWRRAALGCAGVTTRQLHIMVSN